ncbi:MAG: short-chain dehydrogenase [Firmicutes bacterium]|nr:short-chain dehydrogenase [Bacillota bacterium]
MEAMNGTKTALITGVTSGMGREFTYLLARDGYNLILVARDAAKLSVLETELKEQYPGLAVNSIVQDLAEPEAAGMIYRAVEDIGVSVDILISNAGFNVYGSVEQTSMEVQNALIQVNAITPTMLAKLFLPGMLAKKAGKLLFLGSTASYCAATYSAVYCASKAYVLRFSESLSMEVRDTGVTVTCLCPGATRTEFAAKANLKKTRLFNIAVMDAKKVAQIGYQALIHKRPVVISGWFNKLLVKSMPFTPRCIADAMSCYLMAERGR